MTTVFTSHLPPYDRCVQITDLTPDVSNGSGVVKPVCRFSGGGGEGGTNLPCSPEVDNHVYSLARQT